MEVRRRSQNECESSLTSMQLWCNYQKGVFLKACWTSWINSVGSNRVSAIMPYSILISCTHCNGFSYICTVYIYSVFCVSVARDLTLVVCVWEAPPVELHSSPTCHMAAFDINRWYHSQMPASIRYVLECTQTFLLTYLSIPFVISRYPLYHLRNPLFVSTA